MKKPVLYSLAGAFVLLFCIGIGLLYGRVRQERTQAVCTGLEVSFADSLRFVSEEDVRTSATATSSASVSTAWGFPGSRNCLRAAAP